MEPNPRPGLRSILNRTGALVSGSALGRLLPHGDEDPDGFIDDAPEKTGRGLRFPKLERPAWLATSPTARPLTAISLESSSLRFLSFASQKVLGWATVQLRDGAVRAGQIQDPTAIGTELDETFDRLNLARSRVAWALPGFQAACRIVDLPPQRPAELTQAINEEVERSMGTSANESYLFWQRLTGRFRQRSVFILAVPKTTVLTALETLEVANIRPLSMDLRPLALARAVGRHDAIIANLEDDGIDIVILEQGIPALLRSMPLLNANLSREAAQNRLIDETERALTYYDDANPDHPLDVDTPLFLTGSLATGIAIAERARAVTRHPIGRLSTSVAHPSDFPLSEYLVSLGLALKRF